LAAADFYTGLFSTALAGDELLVDVEIGANAERTGVAFEEVARRHGDFALLGIAAVLRMDADQAVRDARVVAVNTTMGAQRLRSVEVALVGRRANDAALFDAGEAAALEVAAGADVHASAAYRRQLARVLVRRALTRAAARATG
jgi:carbon-monoxide dehydrogenase medium subunit